MCLTEDVCAYAVCVCARARAGFNAFRSHRSSRLCKAVYRPCSDRSLLHLVCPCTAKPSNLQTFIGHCSTVQQVQQSTEQKEKRRQKESSDERQSSNEKACRSKSGWSTHADWEGRVAGVGRVACNVRRTSAQHACHTAGLLLLSCSPLSTLVHVPTTRII